MEQPLSFDSSSESNRHVPTRSRAMPKTILVVEDNELNMKLFNDLLEAHGYRVVQTRDGLSALDVAR
jgi:PleD family two-component response regulator